MGGQRSRENEVNKISTSVFVTIFSDLFTAKELWNVCKQYGNVVDAYIQNRISKAGKRFKFVHFINVFDEERLERDSKEVDVGLKSVPFLGKDSDVEEVSETKFEEEMPNSKLEEVYVGQKNSRSEDPFNIYGLLNKKHGDITTDSCVDDSLKYPSGFTPTCATGEHSNKGVSLKRRVANIISIRTMKR
nr:RNA-directed DNA polymerase, eukaryota, reverse transcriptase zinc-binding domain protein [Tanacetum cinerariifolium]